MSAGRLRQHEDSGRPRGRKAVLDLRKESRREGRKRERGREQGRKKGQMEGMTTQGMKEGR